MSRRLVSLLLCLGVAASLAAQECPHGPLPPAVSAAEHARTLAQLAPRCAHDVDFLVWQGTVNLALGRPVAAAEALERALMLAPEHRGAALAFVRALAALGDPETARALWARHADADPALLTESPLARTAWQIEGAVHLRLGYDDNLDRAPSLDRLTLTLPGGDVVLRLANPLQPVAGLFRQADLELAGRRSLGADGFFEVAGRILHRNAAGGHHQEQLDLLAHWRQSFALGETSLLAGFGEFRWRGALLQRQLRLGARWLGEPRRCRPLVGGDLEIRRHPVQPLLDHQELQANLGWLCDGARPWLAQLLVGHEFASARPGGAAQRVLARLLAFAPLAGGRLEGELRLGARRESEPYSPWLAHGAALATHTLALRLDWRKPLARGWEFLVGAESERQWANLPLFAQRRAAVYTALSWRW